MNVFLHVASYLGTDHFFGNFTIIIPGKLIKMIII